MGGGWVTVRRRPTVGGKFRQTRSVAGSRERRTDVTREDSAARFGFVDRFGRGLPPPNSICLGRARPVAGPAPPLDGYVRARARAHVSLCVCVCVCGCTMDHARRRHRHPDDRPLPPPPPPETPVRLRVNGRAGRVRAHDTTAGL